MKKTTRVNHPPAVELPPGNRPLVAPIYQSVKFEFETLEDTERFLRGERPGFFYYARLQPHHAAAGAAAGGAAGARGLPGHRLRCGGDRADAARAHQAGRSRAVLHRDLQSDALPDPPPARPFRRRAHPALHRGLRRRRARARRAADAAGVLREPHQSGHQDRRHRRAHAPGARRRRAHASWTTPLPASTSTATTRSTCSCTASPSTPPGPAT